MPHLVKSKCRGAAPPRCRADNLFVVNKKPPVNNRRLLLNDKSLLLRASCQQSGIDALYLLSPT